MAPMLEIAGYITREELELEDLILNQPGPIKVMPEGFGPGRIEKDRKTVSSPFVDGDFLVNCRKEQATTRLAVRINGESATDAHYRLGELVDALDQDEFFLVMVVDDVRYAYACQSADYEIGEQGMWERFRLVAWKIELVADIPRYPVPADGYL